MHLPAGVHDYRKGHCGYYRWTRWSNLYWLEVDENLWADSLAGDMDPLRMGRSVEHRGYYCNENPGQERNGTTKRHDCRREQTD